MPRSAAPPYRVGEITWECWITSDGQRYVWRAAGDRLLVSRHTGSREHWAKVDGVALPSTYKSPRLAMFAAYRAMMMRSYRNAG